MESTEGLRCLFQELGLDLNEMISDKKRLGNVHDIVYLAEVFGIDLGYKFTELTARKPTHFRVGMNRRKIFNELDIMIISKFGMEISMSHQTGLLEIV